MKRPYQWTAFLGLLLLSACGGGGGGGGGTASTYTIGGSISGLGNTSGLVLVDNGGNGLTVPPNSTTFTFSTAVANGASYAVTVQTQPSGETCTVSNGSGPVSGADVTSVSVNCTANATYTIGGSITGLTADTGVVLVDNGGNALTVPANASSFTFSAPLANGATYAVTVQTQPTGESCMVSAGSGPVSGANVTSVAISCSSNFATSAANIVAVSVNAGPATSAYQTFNIPLATVEVCQGATCATIPNVLVDTGSSGLRLMASALTAAGLAPTPETSGGYALYECVPYADGYTWGEVAGGTAATMTVTLGQEVTTSSVPIQVIDDNNSQPLPPAGCTGFGASLDAVNALDANGVLGVGVANQDCGTACVSASNNIYYLCPGVGAGNACSSPSSPGVPANEQVANPVASLPKDNNGVIMQLPAIPSTGAATANGYLVLGIGTETNNTLSGVTIYTTSAAGDFTTVFSGQSLTQSFIDSGSNALYFPNITTPALATCGSAAPLSDFYCPANSPPSGPQSFTATAEGNNGNSAQITFQVADLTSLNTNNFALNDVAGLATGTLLTTNYFDWGMPFFYGRTIYVAIEGMAAGSGTGPYDAF